MVKSKDNFFYCIFSNRLEFKKRVVFQVVFYADYAVMFFKHLDDLVQR